MGIYLYVAGHRESDSIGLRLKRLCHMERCMELHREVVQ